MIYLIANRKARACKIGFSKNPNKRLAQLRTASPTELVLLATIAGTVWEERGLHEKFARHRMNGEWFKIAPEILAHFGVEDKPRTPKEKPVSKTFAEGLEEFRRYARSNPRTYN